MHHFTRTGMHHFTKGIISAVWCGRTRLPDNQKHFQRRCCRRQATFARGTHQALIIEASRFLLSHYISSNTTTLKRDIITYHQWTYLTTNVPTLYMYSILNDQLPLINWNNIKILNFPKL